MKLSTWSAAIILSILLVAGASAQTPEIAPSGVVNAASWNSPVVPGGMMAIFGKNLAATEQSASSPLPFTLGGTSVTINGVPAPVAFVSPGQINAQVPASLKTTNSTIDAAAVIVTTAAGSSAPAVAGLAPGSPGIFTADGSGCGLAAALNIATDGKVSLNSRTNSAAPGDYIALFGTGFGLAAQQPADGVAAASALSLQTVPGLLFDKKPVFGLQYAGLAPGMVGVDQVNFQIPASTRNGCSVPVSASRMLGSPPVTLSIQAGRGQCIDPPVQSWGQLTFSKSVISSLDRSIRNFESFTGSFPAGPSVQAPAPEQIVFAPDYASHLPAVTGGIILSAVPFSTRTCAVPGYDNLSAGAIRIEPQSGNGVTAKPLPAPPEGVVYSETLPDGFIQPGTYSISGLPGSPVELKASLNIGAPIQLLTAFPPGTVISSSQPLTVKWTGGDPATLVKVTLTSGGLSPTSLNTYANATAGSLTISPLCTQANPLNGPFCTFGIPPSPNAQLSVQVLPAPDRVTTLSVPGITGAVQLKWQYSWTFLGIDVAN